MNKLFKKYNDLFQEVNKRRHELIIKKNDNLTKEEEKEYDFCNFITELFVSHSFPKMLNIDIENRYKVYKILNNPNKNKKYYSIFDKNNKILRPMDEDMIFTNRKRAKECLNRHKEIEDFQGAKVRKVSINLE